MASGVNRDDAQSTANVFSYLLLLDAVPKQLLVIDINNMSNM